MLKIAIIGCGKIADSHASQIQRIPGCEIVAACDREELMARQFHERFRVKYYSADLQRLLQESRPDVVHITTPPQTHFALGKQCLESGCHIYVEKPFTLNTREAKELIRLSEERKLRLTVGHDDQFSHVARRMRHQIREGYLGGVPVHMESHYCYDLGGSNYAKALLGDKQHWVRRLPGGLFQNVISHGIARIAEYLTGELAHVVTHSFVSPFLQQTGENEIFDEIRVIVADKLGTTAYLTFSSQMRPSLHQFRVYGPRNGVMLDEDQQTLIMLDGKRLKSYAEKFVPSIRMAKQYVGNCLINLRLFAQNDFQMKSGMKFLIQSFYRSITKADPLPISHQEIILNSEIMDAIIAQLGQAKRGSGIAIHNLQPESTHVSKN
jgi:predicted dehydrogenase